MSALFAFVWPRRLPVLCSVSLCLFLFVSLMIMPGIDDGQHWTRTVIDVSGAAPVCNPCGFAYLSSQMALRVGSDDTIYLLWNGTTIVKNFVPERIFFSRSTDHGVSYSQRTQISDSYSNRSRNEDGML